MAGAPRAALRFGVRGFISTTGTIARGVTAMVVGSGALLGSFYLASEERAEFVHRILSTESACGNKPVMDRTGVEQHTSLIDRRLHDELPDDTRTSFRRIDGNLFF